MRKCKNPECRKKYEPTKPLQTACSIPCALAIAAIAMEKKAKRLAIEQRKEVRKKKMDVKPLSFFAKQAQSAFNAYIRERDKDDPCISCQRFHDGQYHAGHYFTVGAHPELRFNEDNCHKQCSVCNNHMSGNIEQYTPNLILKIGEVRFSALKEFKKLPKLKRDDYEKIRDEYKNKLKELKANK